MEKTREFRQVCKFIKTVTVPLLKSKGDKRSEKRIIEESISQYKTIYEEMLDNVEKDFDLQPKELQLLIYAYLKNAMQELIQYRTELTYLPYIKWVVDTELEHEICLDELVRIVEKKPLKPQNCVEYKEIARQNFRVIIERRFRGKVVGEYLTKDKGVECICLQGHQCFPVFSSLRQGKGMCKTCAGNDTNFAKNRFYKIMEEKKWKVLGKYLNKYTYVLCNCPEGHECNISPDSVQQGKLCCHVCMKNHWKGEFQHRIDIWGGTMLEEYQSSKIPVKCKCSEGHICMVTLRRITCKTCNVLKQQSQGEAKLILALQQIFDNEKIIPEYTPKMLDKGLFRSLRYDAAVKYKKKMLLYEYHGEHHERQIKFFHTKEEFILSRQRDLVKIHVAKKHKMQLVVFDYKWLDKPVDIWVDYIREKLNSNEIIIAESPLHGWIHNEKPTQESLDKYIVLD